MVSDTWVAICSREASVRVGDTPVAISRPPRGFCSPRWRHSRCHFPSASKILQPEMATLPLPFPVRIEAWQSETMAVFPLWDEVEDEDEHLGRQTWRFQTHVSGTRSGGQFWQRGGREVENDDGVLGPSRSHTTGCLLGGRVRDSTSDTGALRCENVWAGVPFCCCMLCGDRFNDIGTRCSRLAIGLMTRWRLRM